MGQLIKLLKEIQINPYNIINKGYIGYYNRKSDIFNDVFNDVKKLYLIGCDNPNYYFVLAFHKLYLINKKYFDNVEEDWDFDWNDRNYSSNDYISNIKDKINNKDYKIIK